MAATIELGYRATVSLSPRAGLLLVVLLALGAHAATLRNGFVFDDRPAVLENPAVAAPLDLAKVLGTNFWGRPPGEKGGGSWRPLAVLSFWADWRIGGGAPWAFHATNVVCHALATLALALAVWRFTGRLQLGVLTGVVFAAMAVNTEAVASVVGRADVMAAGFGFLAWWLAGPPGEVPSAARLAVVGTAFLGSLLCKESALLLAVLIPTVEFIARSRSARQVRIAAALGAATAAYLLLRWLCFRSPEVTSAGNINQLIGEPLDVRAWTALRFFTLTIRLALAPVDLAPDYSFAEIMPERSPFGGEVLLGAALLASLIAAALVARRRAPTAAAALAVVTLVFGGTCLRLAAIPALGFALPPMFGERLLYIPAAGVALVLAALVERRGSRAWLGLLTVFCAANFARGVARDLDWRDDLTLFEKAVVTTPRSARSWTNYGAALLGADKPAEALSALERAIAIAPDSASPHALAGVVLDRLGNYPMAEQAMRRALAVDSKQADSSFNLALFLARRSRYDEAAQVLRALPSRSPREAALLRDVEADLARKGPLAP